MDSSTRAAISGSHLAQNDSPEQLLDVFKAAALSVTKLYKTSAKAEARARADGYQDCLEDLLFFLDKENIGLCDGEGWRTRRWIAERLGLQDPALQSTESEDETEKSERTCSPEVIRTSAEPPAPSPAHAHAHATTTTVMTPPPPAIAPAGTDPTMTTTTTHFVVPSQDSFSFQSQYPNIATLDLSDARAQEGSAFSASRNAKARFPGSSSRSLPRPSSHLGRGAGTKRRVDFDDFFGGCLDGKEPFGNGSKRSRHA